MKKEHAQSLEHELELARRRSKDIERVELTPDEDKRLFLILNKAINAEKAGDLAKALEFYTDYKNELLRIKEQKEGTEFGEKEQIWNGFLKQIENSYRKLFISHFLKEKFIQAKDEEKDEDAKMLWQDKIDDMQEELEEILDYFETISDFREINVKFWNKHNYKNKNALVAFDISDEELEKYKKIGPPNIPSLSWLMKKGWQIKPALKQDLEKLIREDEKAQQHVEKLYQEKLEAQKASSQRW